MLPIKYQHTQCVLYNFIIDCLRTYFAHKYLQLVPKEFYSYLSHIALFVDVDVGLVPHQDLHPAAPGVGHDAQQVAHGAWIMRQNRRTIRPEEEVHTKIATKVKLHLNN